MASRQFLLFSLLSLLTVCRGQCPISGCDGLRSFSTAAAASKNASSTPRLVWSYELHRPSGAGCVTNGAGNSAAIVCPMADGQNVSVISFAPNGSVLWYISLASQAVLPLLSYNGQSVLSDGHTLAWLAHDGRSLAPPVHLFPVQGLLFDLTITLSTSIVTMLYRCGFIATYTVDGVPISGLWLNATVRGAEGTFIPLGDPVMNDTHLYIMTAFRASSPTGSGPAKRITAENSTLLRLYAIDVAASLVRKFTILWTHDIYVSGYIPYMYSKETYCPFTHQHRQGHASSGRGAMKEMRSESYFPISLMTMESDRLLVAVRFESAAGTRTFNTSVRDLGETYSVVSSGCTNTSVTSIIWGNTDKGTATPEKYNRLWSKGRNQFQNEGSKFWVSSFFPQKNVTVLEELAELAGPSVNGSSITLPTSLTTPVTLLQIAPGDSARSPTTDILVFGSSGGVSCDKTQLDKPKRPRAISDTVPLQQYGNVTRGKVRGGKSECAPDNNQPQLVAVEMKEGSPNVVWSVSLPHSQPVLGQITTLSLSPQPLLCLTTPLGVYAYTF